MPKLFADLRRHSAIEAEISPMTPDGGRSHGPRTGTTGDGAKNPARPPLLDRSCSVKALFTTNQGVGFVDQTCRLNRRQAALSYHTRATAVSNGRICGYEMVNTALGGRKRDSLGRCAMPFKLVSLLGLALCLAGCSTFPSGAGLESEVLAHSDEVLAGTATATSRGVPTEFAVETVTRDNLARFARWYTVGEPSLPWIIRVDQPNIRIISPSDTVSLTIWSTDDNGLLSSEGQRSSSLPALQVSPDGTIFLPYVGRLSVGGLTIDEARQKIETAYAVVVPSIQVELELAAGRQSAVSVIGGVNKPGVYPLHDQDVTLLEVLAEAGGAAGDLNNPQVRLQRANRTYGISLDRLLDDARLNSTLIGGDRIYVSEDKRYFLSLGAAAKETQVNFPRDRITALDAVSLIGGLTDDRANASGILVLRHYPESAVRRDGTGPRHVRTIFTVDLTTADGLFSAGQFTINAGDLIYVTESAMIDTSKTLNMIGVAFGLGNSAQNLQN